MQVKSIAILSTFIRLPFIIKIFVLSMFEWSLKTGFICIINHAVCAFRSMGTYKVDYSNHAIIFLILLFPVVSIAEVERLWVRFQQLGCNNDGVLTEDAMKKSSYANDIFMRNASIYVLSSHT